MRGEAVGLKRRTREGTIDTPAWTGGWWCRGPSPTPRRLDHLTDVLDPLPCWSGFRERTHSFLAGVFRPMREFELAARPRRRSCRERCFHPILAGNNRSASGVIGAVEVVAGNEVRLLWMGELAPVPAALSVRCQQIISPLAGARDVALDGVIVQQAVIHAAPRAVVSAFASYCGRWPAP